MATLSTLPEVHHTTQDLLVYIHASPTPHHCVEESSRRLDALGFSELDEAERWKLEPGKGYFYRHGGALLAFRTGAKPAAEAGFRLIGAHTDSPNLRIKPQPDVKAEGYMQLGV